MLVGVILPWFTLLREWSTGSLKNGDRVCDRERKKERHKTPVSTKDGGIRSSISALCGRGTHAAEQWRSVEVHHHGNRDTSKITASINCLNELLWTRLHFPKSRNTNLKAIWVKLHPVVLREHFELFWHRYFALDAESLITERGVCGA